MAFFRRSRLVERRADGGFDIRLSDDERQVLAGLVAQLADQLDDTADPSLHRLAPPAYQDDPERDAAYQLLAGEELRDARREAIATVVETAARPRITEDEAWAWLRALTTRSRVPASKSIAPRTTSTRLGIRSARRLRRASTLAQAARIAARRATSRFQVQASQTSAAPRASTSRSPRRGGMEEW